MLSDEIKIARRKSFVSQDLFAKELHVAVSTVNRWEVGKARPNLSAMKSIKDFCVAHNVPYDPIETAWLNYEKEENENA